KTQLQVSVDVTEDIPAKIQAEISGQLEIFGHILKKEIIPELKENKIVFYYNGAIRKEHIPEIKEIFLSKVLSFIQPLFLEGNIRQQFLPENNKLYLIVTLKEENNATLRYTVVNIPSDKLKRFFVLTQFDGYDYVIFIDDIIRENLHS